MAQDYEADYPILTDLQRAVIGSIPEDRNLWRINWLKSLLDAIDGEQIVISKDCEDPSAILDCIQECQAMVRDVNAALP